MAGPGRPQAIKVHGWADRRLSSGGIELPCPFCLRSTEGLIYTPAYAKAGGWWSGPLSLSCDFQGDFDLLGAWFTPFQWAINQKLSPLGGMPQILFNLETGRRIGQGTCGSLPIRGSESVGRMKTIEGFQFLPGKDKGHPGKPHHHHPAPCPDPNTHSSLEW